MLASRQVALYHIHDCSARVDVLLSLSVMFAIIPATATVENRSGHRQTLSPPRCHRRTTASSFHSPRPESLCFGCLQPKCYLQRQSWPDNFLEKCLRESPSVLQHLPGTGELENAVEPYSSASVQILICPRHHDEVTLACSLKAIACMSHGRQLDGHEERLSSSSSLGAARFTLCTLHTKDATRCNNVQTKVGALSPLYPAGAP